MDRPSALPIGETVYREELPAVASTVPWTAASLDARPIRARRPAGGAGETERCMN